MYVGDPRASLAAVSAPHVPSTVEVALFDPARPAAAGPSAGPGPGPGPSASSSAGPGPSAAAGPTLIDLGRPTVLWAAPGSLYVDEVAAAWARRGDTADLAAVSGPWAVLLWCPRTRTHVLAVDPLGVQPLCWARTADGRVAAASWLAALVDRPDVDDTVDAEGVLLDASNQLWSTEVAHRTRFVAVERVPWGMVTRIAADGSARRERYWDPAALPGPDASLSLSDCAELLRERLDASIARLMVGPAIGAADPAAPDPAAPGIGLGGTGAGAAPAIFGAHVSGGLDCTSVACRSHALLGEAGSGLRAIYSWTPDEREVPRFPGDERGLLDDVSAQLGLPMWNVYGDESGDWFRLRDPHRYPESTHVRERFVLPRAQADGVRVMMSGWGGDELASFNGRGVPTWLVRHGRWVQVWRDGSARLRVASGARPSLARRGRAFAGKVWGALPERVTDLRHRDTARLVRAHEAEMDARLRAFSPVAAEAYRARRRLFAEAKDHHAYQLALLWSNHMQHRTFAWYQTGRLFGVEYRYPLLDVHLVEAALRLPWWAFLSQGWGRTAFRLAVEPWVPASVAWNPAKYEPANFWPPERMEVPRSVPEPEVPVEADARVCEAMLLAQGMRRPLQRRISDTARVQVRPEMAPRP